MNGIIALIIALAPQYQLDPALVAAVIEVESNFSAKTIGDVGEIGLMQIKPSTAQLSQRQLFNPEKNLIAGLTYLSYVKINCKYTENDLFVVCYNRGVKGGNRLKHPKRDAYYKKVRNAKAKWDRKLNLNNS